LGSREELRRGCDGRSRGIGLADWFLGVLGGEGFVLVEEVEVEMLGSGVSFLLFSSLSLLGSGALSMRRCSCKELS
jgi:hypothetical protein